MTILNLNISYPDFQLGDVIDPQSFDLNNSEIVTKINEIKEVVNLLTDGTTGASNVSLASIAPFASTKVQAFLQEMIDRLKATSAGVSGADFVGTPTIAGVTGATVASQLASFKSLLDAASTAQTTGLATHKTSADHDGRYFTETELGSTTSGSSGAKKIGATPISTSPSDVQGILEWLKNQVDSAVAGTIPDGSLGAVKLAFDVATQSELDTHAKDLSHIEYGSATGSANTYAVTITPAPTSYTDGLAVSVKINIDSNAASTLNVNGLGAKALKKANGTDITNFKANGVYTFRYNSTTGNFIIQGEGGGGTAVAGDVLSGKTATVDSGDITGSMVNRGAMAITASSTNQVIPAGFHNGSGVVNAVVVDPTKVLTGTTIAGTTGTIPIRSNGQNPATGTAQWPDGGLAVYLEGGYYAGGAGAGEVKVTPAQLQIADGDLHTANIKTGVSIFGIAGSLIEGKRYASGTATSGTSVNNGINWDGATGYFTYPVVVSGLSFLPSTIFMKWYDNSYRYGIYKAESIDYSGGGLVKYSIASWQNPSYGQGFQMGGGISVSNGGFTLSASTSGRTCEWWAFE